MQQVTVSGAKGTTAAGIFEVIDASKIKQTTLMVVVPSSQDSILLSPTFRQARAEFEETYKTAVEVIPVEGW